MGRGGGGSVAKSVGHGQTGAARRAGKAGKAERGQKGCPHRSPAGGTPLPARSSGRAPPPRRSREWPPAEPAPPAQFPGQGKQGDRGWGALSGTQVGSEGR